MNFDPNTGEAILETANSERTETPANDVFDLDSPEFDPSSPDFNVDRVVDYLKQFGIDIQPADLQELLEFIPNLIKNFSPELAQILIDQIPQIENIVKQSNNLKAEGKEKEAAKLAAEFVLDFLHETDKIKDSETKETLMAYLGTAIDLNEIKDHLSDQTKLEIVSMVWDCLPIIGGPKMAVEAVVGKTLTGEKLEGNKRKLHGLEGVGYIALDIATYGASAAARTAAKGGVETAKVATTAKKGKTALNSIHLARGISRIAAVSRKFGKSPKLANSIFKLSKIVRANPKLANALLKFSVKQRAIHKLRTGLKIKNTIKDVRSDVSQVVRAAGAAKKAA